MFTERTLHVGTGVGWTSIAYAAIARVVLPDQTIKHTVEVLDLELVDGRTVGVSIRHGNPAQAHALFARAPDHTAHSA